MGVPLSQMWTVAKYVLTQRIKGVERRAFAAPPDAGNRGRTGPTQKIHLSVYQRDLTGKAFRELSPLKISYIFDSPGWHSRRP